MFKRIKKFIEKLKKINKDWPISDRGAYKKINFPPRKKK